MLVSSTIVRKREKTNYLERLISFLDALSSRRCYEVLLIFMEMDLRILISCTSPVCLLCKVQDFTVLFILMYNVEDLSRNLKLILQFRRLLRMLLMFFNHLYIPRVILVLMVQIMVIMILEVLKCETECSDYFMFVLKPILNV